MQLWQQPPYNGVRPNSCPPTMRPDPATARFKRRLLSLAIIAAAGMALLVARVVWLQALQ